LKPLTAAGWLSSDLGLTLVERAPVGAVKVASAAEEEAW
jgi:hypothetical protein